MNAPAFQHWLDRFFSSYYRHRPVNATFIGIHDYDDRLPDYSPAGVEAVQADTSGLLAELRILAPEPLADSEQLDRRLAEGFLEIQRWEYGSSHFQAGNPCVYTGEAAFGVLSLLRRPFAPLKQRLEHATARLNAIPELLAQGQANLRSVPQAWAEKASDECAGLLALCTEGIPALLAEHKQEHPALLAAAQRAAQATLEFKQFIERGAVHSAGQYACGEEAFARYLHSGHFLHQSAAEIAAYAKAQIAECSARLQEGAAAFGESDWRVVIARQAESHPTLNTYLRRYAELWDACYATAAAHQLVTWPDFPIRYLPRPRWVRSAAPHLYFLFYHAPAPFDKLPELEYLVTPIEPGIREAEQEQLLRANNESVIKLNHVVHHGALGHHVQNWYAARAKSRIGQIAAVDCASRIALFCGGTMAEGWACYATDLMDEYGFLTPLEHYAEQHTRMRMATRALADVRLHHREWSLDDAARFYHETLGMPPAAARGEAIKNSMFPATALMYLMGADAIHSLRRTLQARPGFSLRAFHDRLLSFGSVPVPLVAEAMLNTPNEVLYVE